MVNGALMDCVINNAYNSTAPVKSQKGLNACLHHSEKTGSTRYQEGKKGSTHDINLKTALNEEESAALFFFFRLKRQVSF